MILQKINLINGKHHSYVNKLRDSMDPEDVSYMKKIEAEDKLDDPHYNDLVMKPYHSLYLSC
ncbi:hypothetical protein AO469_07795 [Oenococcus oeni]|nr:hypothetical protein AO469_07795 [Oenococcus oeni]